jgi:putative PIN family toxin of toxin-antitoxin system
VGKERTKVTLDTNIVISALGWRGNPHTILEKVMQGELEFYLSYEQFEELSRVLEYPKFDFTEEQKIRFKALISSIATFVQPAIELDVIKADPADNRVLECALVAKLDFIISGDDHLLSIRRFGRTKIMTATNFLNQE